MLNVISRELKAHSPFTAIGAASGIAVMLVFLATDIPISVSRKLFWVFHPFHVLLSALATASMYRLHGKGVLWKAILIGYTGSIGIATLSDSIIPYVGEWLLDLPNRGIHPGFVEKWWLVNPMAAAGIAIACIWPETRFPHAGHVLLSTWASMFHMSMAMGAGYDFLTMGLVAVFLFLAVWIPCCTSDIVFPLLFSEIRRSGSGPFSAKGAESPPGKAGTIH